MTSDHTKENVEILRDFTNRALRENKGMVPVLTFALKEVFDFIEALEQDAARYRWIRDTCKGEPQSAEFWPGIALFELSCEADEAFCDAPSLDIAIDEAIAQQDKKEVKP